jgi:hypothetical protein
VRIRHGRATVSGEPLFATDPIGKAGSIRHGSAKSGYWNGRFLISASHEGWHLCSSGFFRTANSQLFSS